MTQFMHSHIFILGCVMYTDRFLPCFGTALWTIWLAMITEVQYNDLEMASLTFVCQEAFGHPEIEEGMQEVFRGDRMGVDVIEWGKYWNLLTDYCEKVNDGIVNAVPPMVCDICMLMLLC